MALWWTLLQAWFVYSFFCGLWGIASYLVLIRLNFDKLPPERREEFRAFERLDWERMSKPGIWWRVALGAFFLAPIRIVLFFIAVTSLRLGFDVVALLCRLKGWDVDNVPLPKTSQNMLWNATFLSCALGLKSAGILETREHWLQGKPRSREELRTTVVSNHVSALDVVYFCKACFPSYVAKKTVRNVPIAGKCGQLIQSVYVDRFTEGGRHQALDALQKRQEALHRGEIFPPLLIFPEGTTSNGRGLLPFKRGAFNALLPVTPVVLIYRSSMTSLAFDLLPMKWWAALVFLTSSPASMDIYWLPPVSPPPPKSENETEEERTERVHAFMTDVRQRMWDVLMKYQERPVPPNVKHDDWKGNLGLSTSCFNLLLSLSEPVDQRKRD